MYQRDGQDKRVINLAQPQSKGSSAYPFKGVYRPKFETKALESVPAVPAKLSATQR
ncbi:protein of unknown function (plasmid) [Pseudorhizobium banfieldiae]|uniref:Uncharacterized protein n=1 Tax=Pseudorhizobium banfieldiae TaxID=1125847 RepID=L0NMR5_9HYPH|nr:protein of unknown function [Pseudorhizobium banfieldiae]CCF22382.1 protein of unknown function [Pseudorhizobium banfieldiae]